MYDEHELEYIEGALHELSYYLGCNSIDILELLEGNLIDANQALEIAEYIMGLDDGE